MSNSTLTDALRYLRSRLLQRRIAALWLLLLAARGAAGPVESVAGLLTPALFLGLATAVLRLWDDLADREHDCHIHPERVLVTSNGLGHFAAAVALALLLLAAALLADWQRLAVYAMLLAWLATLYHSRLRLGVPRPVRAGLVLVKYPVLVFLAGAEPSGRAWLTGIFLYAALLIYEWRDDRELRAAPVHQVVIGLGSGAAIISALLLPGNATP